MPDIKETKEAVSFALQLGNALGSALDDGKLSWSDTPKFMGSIMAAPAAFSGIGSVPTELKDLDAAEKKELMDYVKSEFDIPDDKIEGLVEEGLALAVQTYNFVQKVRS